jgi:glycosyltransferase involved in cell wall biosynthesis
MKSVVFVTVADLSGQRGDSMATRNLVTAIADLSDHPVELVCPKPADELPQSVVDAVKEARFLPPKGGAGTMWWHVRTEIQVLRHLAAIRARGPVERVVTRLYPSAIAPVLFCEATGVTYTLLIRGWVNRIHKGGDTKYADAVEHVVKRNVRHADDVYVAFEALREWVADYKDPDDSPVRVLPNAVDPDLFQPREDGTVRADLDIADSVFVVGFVGSLEPRHMLPQLLEGAAKTDAHLLIVGDGQQRDRLKRIAEENGITDRVHFAGFVPHESVATYISAFDAGYGVMHPEKPSNPIKCYEYLACGKPVITSRAPEMEFVESNDFGVVLDDPTSEAVAQAIEVLAATDDRRREDRGTRARRYVVDNCTWRGIAAEILEGERASDVTC